MDSDKMLKALDAFFEEDFERAEDAGYQLTTATDMDGRSIFVDVTTNYEDLPSINVTPKKRMDGDWIFDVSVSFPDLDLSKGNETLKEIVESWKDAIAFADELQSIKFSPEEWID